MVLFQLKFLIPIFIHNFTLQLPNTCSMVPALLKDALRTMSARSTFPRSILHILLSRRMTILTMLALTMAELLERVRTSLTIDIWSLIPESSWYSLTVISIWKSVALSKQTNISTSTSTRVQIVPLSRQKAMMRFIIISMPDIFPLLKYVTTSLKISNAYRMVSCLLSIHLSSRSTVCGVSC